MSILSIWLKIYNACLFVVIVTQAVILLSRKSMDVMMSDRNQYLANYYKFPSSFYLNIQSLRFFLEIEFKI